MGIVFDIQRFAIQDGPGIRTTVFLKGCPLRCLWCHNPEAIRPVPQLSYNPDRCTHCMACVPVCAQSAHAVVDDKHALDFRSCAGDAHCVAACPHQALEMIGGEMTVEAVLEEVERDRPYFERSGGGLTVSGGEPFSQFPFMLALLQGARQRGIHTCLDTSGMVSRRKLEAAAGCVDLFLFDYKATPDSLHRELTGAPSKQILENLAYLYERKARIRLRCPLVPGMNDSAEHLTAIAALSIRYPDLEGIELLPYHSMGREKAARIGCENVLSALPGADERTQARWIGSLREMGCERATLG